MREYDFKRGFTCDLGRIRSIMEDLFGEVEEREGKIITRWGSLSKLAVWVDEQKKVMCVETESNPSCDRDTIRKTIDKFNEFLERATGYSSRERRKKLMRDAKVNFK